MKYISLKKPSEFSRVYKRGKSYADRYLVLYAIPNKVGYCRLGLSISKKVGNSVTRNRVRRLIKEVYRLHCPENKNYDYIVIARVNASKAVYKDVEKSFLNLLKKAGIQ
ncbi:ribonuclease P protein component [Fusibacter sp. JL298sf-3]